jgi:hypothetical protein
MASSGLSVSQRRGACSPSEAPQDAIAEAHERLTKHFADGIVVFGVRMVSLPRRLRAGEGSREEPRADRETSVEGRYAEEAALLRFTVDVDESAMLLDDAMAKVHEDLFDLCVVGFDGLKIGGNEFHFDVLVDDLVEETGEAVECFVEVDGAGLKGLATREGGEFASERSGAVGLLADRDKGG